MRLTQNASLALVESDDVMKRVPLPTAIIPFILAHLDAFDAVLEDEDRIVITPKDGAVVTGTPPTTPAPPRSILRPKHRYRIVDRHRTPTEAKRYGFSEPRLKVYQAIWDAPGGILAKDIMDKTGIAHGSVQQILHWLKSRKFISGEPEA